jgi:monovalent cation/hydrogen antiporter
VTSPVHLLELVLALLAVAVLLAIVSRRIGLPPATGYLLGGIGLAFVPGLPQVEVDPELAMILFVPPLLMSSAYFTVWRDFRANLRPIALLAVGAVAFTTWIVALAAHWVMPDLPWAACVTLGAIVSPPDAVAAKAVFARLPMPRRLVTVLEGESLVNDASGLLLYRVAVAAAMSGQFELLPAIGTFAWLAVGGVGIGLGCGWAVMKLLRQLHDRSIIVLVTFLACWLSYLSAEAAGASGVLSVVTCGILMGWRQHDVLRADSRTAGRATWQTVEFCLEALVFIFIGLSLSLVLKRIGDGTGVLSVLPLVLAVSGSVVLARIVWLLPPILVPGWIWPRLGANEPPPPAQAIVMAWAGMRGVISMAVAIGLPQDFPGRDRVIIATFGVILLTLVVQGPTLAPLVRALGLKPDPPEAGGMPESATRAAVNEASLRFLEARGEAADHEHDHQRLVDEFRARTEATARLRDEGEEMREVEHSHYTEWLRALEAGREALLSLHRSGEIHDDVLHAVEAELDFEELRLTRLKDGTDSSETEEKVEGS